MDGHTYERAAIEKWFQNSNSSPLTNEKLENKLLVPNRRLKAIIASVLQIRATSEAQCNADHSQ